MDDAEAPEPSLLTTAASNRKRRNPYTPIACDECKRRKTKCTGERPCRGCRNTDTLCIFERTTRYRASSSVRPLFLNDEEVELATMAVPPAAASQAVEAAPQPYQQLYSSWSLPAQDWSGLGTEASPLAQIDLTPSPARPTNDHTEPQLSSDNSLIAADLMIQLLSLYREDSLGDIFFHVPPDRWRQILVAYDEEIGMMYPYLDLDAIKRGVAEASQPSSAPAAWNPARERLEHLLILIMALVSGLEDQSIIKMVEVWVEEIYGKYFINAQMNLAASDDVAYLLLCCSFFSLSDRDLMAWRATGAIMRLLLEMGYHRGDPATMLNHPSGRNGYVIEERLFWCVYAFDRHLSFEAGMPFVIRDGDISRDLKFPDRSIEVQFLKHLVILGRIAGDIRDFFASKANHHTGSAESERDFLDYRTVQWRENVTKTLKFGGAGDKFDPSKETHARYRLRAILYLKSNQLRIFLLRRWATKPRVGTFDDSGAAKVAAIARESITIVLNLAQATAIRRHHHRMFNHFIQAALSSLLLALNANRQINAVGVIEDIHSAIELLKRLSFHSAVTLALIEKLAWVGDVAQRLAASETGRGHVQDGTLRAADSDDCSMAMVDKLDIAALDVMNDASPAQDRAEAGDTNGAASHLAPNTWMPAATAFGEAGDVSAVERDANSQQLHVPFSKPRGGGDASFAAVTGSLQGEDMTDGGSLAPSVYSGGMVYQQHAASMADLQSQSVPYQTTLDHVDLQAWLSVLRYPELGELLNDYAFQDSFSF